MKIVDRYLAGQFGRVFGLACLTFLGLFLVVDFFEQLRTLLKYDAQATDLALFFAARVPWMFTQVVPMATLLATLLSVVLLARGGEITALRSGGLPLRRLLLPYLGCGLVLSLGVGFLQEFVAPRGFAFAREVKELRIKGRPAEKLLQAHDLWLRSRDRILHVDHVRVEEQRLTGVQVAELEGSRVVRRIDAPAAVWGDSGWELHDAEVRTFDAGGQIRTERLAVLPYPLADAPDDLEIARLEPDEAGWRELRARVRRHRAQGLDTRDLEVGLWAKTSMPFVNLIMPLLGFPFAVRSSRRGGASLAVVTAVALGFTYWLVLAVGMSLGKAGTLPPPAAAWLGNVLFAGVGLWLVARAERVG